MPAACTTLFEHEHIDFDWTDRDLLLIDRLNRAAGAEILRARPSIHHRQLESTQFVGVIRLGKHTIQVLPKTHRSTNRAESVREATRNLLHMLSYAADVEINEQGVAPLLRHEVDWFEILTHLFATHLADLWSRGAPHAYRTVDQELGCIKGQWRLTDQLRRPASQHRLYVRYDEFTPDTDVNRILRYVVEHLARLSRDGRNVRQLRTLREWMDDVTLMPHVTAADVRPGLITRLNQAYTPLLNLARLFLQSDSLQLATGDADAFSFVFDMNVLFQEFVIGFIRRHRRQILPAGAESWQLRPQSQGISLHLAHETDGKKAFLLLPDLVVKAGHQHPLLVDTKYKRLDPRQPHYGVSSADIYQMHAYATRFQAQRVVLLYPQTVETPNPLHRRYHLPSCAAHIDVRTVDLRADLALKTTHAALITDLRTLFQGLGETA